MKCDRVLDNLSAFLDGMLEEDLTAVVAHHLTGCPGCSRELARLKQLRARLLDLRPVATPDYLHHLVCLRIRNARENTVRQGLRSMLEYQWSRIRTTEGLWYLTRLAGAMATIVLFVVIYSAMNPIYLGITGPLPDHGWMSPPHFRPQQLGNAVLGNLGMRPLQAQKMPVRSSDPKINDLYLVQLGETTSRTGRDDTVSVVTMVDRSGAATMPEILEYPEDESLLSEYTDIIMSAGWRPASKNGRAIDSPLVFTFSKIYVFN
jgi:hypothetical protein